MRIIIFPILTLSIAFLCSCSSNVSDEKSNSADNSEKRTDNAYSDGDCDPLVAEYEQLMEGFKSGIQEMIDNEKMDEGKLEEWGERAEDLSEKVEKKGEQGLGIECWKKFNGMAEQYSSEIPPLAMELVRIEMKNKGLDVDIDALMEQAQENQ